MNNKKITAERNLSTRVRLKRSVMTANEALQTICIIQSLPKNINKLEEKKYMKSSLNQKRMNQTLFNSSIEFDESEKVVQQKGKLNSSAMKALVKICKERKNQLDHFNLDSGLNVRKLVADPTYRRHHLEDQKYDRPLSKNQQTQKFQGHQKMKKIISYRETKGLDIQQFQRHKHNFDDSQVTITNESNFNVFSSIEYSPQKYTGSQSPKKNQSKQYLYEKMIGSEKNKRDQSNLVYEKRITSFTEFLWKMFFSHNIYQNLDLKLLSEIPKIEKVKAYVGFGNNCNMIKGLLKRRYWWIILEEKSTDVNFIWTQIKINNIFEKQPKSEENIPKYVEFEQDPNCIQRKQYAITCFPLHKRKNTFLAKNSLKNIRKSDKLKLNLGLSKILNIQDKRIFQKLEEKQVKKQLSSKIISTNPNILEKQTTFAQKVFQTNKRFKEIKSLEANHCNIMMHNHLQNNFFLGNKKALFYNLREYYSLKKENVFEDIPLTFHIKNGFKDNEYAKFVDQFQKRAKVIKRQEKIQEQEGQAVRKKTRNIWIVKPGENSNQGQGITVIDEIYQLNQIIKSSIQKEAKVDRKEGVEKEKKTWIVQKYLDRPFLYNERKFDIRHYMLITNLHGVMRAYWYEEGYIRTSAYLYNVHDFEPEIHLTNDAIQKKYPQYSKFEPYNKISYSQFQNYLNGLPNSRRYSFQQEILPQMKRMATNAAKSVFNKISGGNRMHNFQIFGLDFMIDRKFKTWLIQINTNPCLDCECPLLDRIIPYMVEQSLKLSLDVIFPPPAHYPNTCRHYAPSIDLQTFKYQLLFDSQVDGDQVLALYQSHHKNIIDEIGSISQDEEFKDNGKQIKLEDYT